MSRGVTVLTNDPDHQRINLAMEATVRYRLVASPAPITLSVRLGPAVGGETLGRDLDLLPNVGSLRSGAARTSRKGMTWRLWPAGQQELAPFQARSGYRVRVALPADMADGRFAESVDFTARPAGAAEGPRGLELQIQGSIDGRVTLFGARSTATASCNWASCKRETAYTRPWS